VLRAQVRTAIVIKTYTAIIRNYSSMSAEEQEREMVQVRGTVVSLPMSRCCWPGSVWHCGISPHVEVLLEGLCVALWYPSPCVAGNAMCPASGAFAACVLV
jgi:hypothetical protein